MHAIVTKAIDDLCAAFERGGYNPTPLIDIGVLVASADGEPDEAERDLLREVFGSLLDAQLTAEVVDHLVTASLEVIVAAGAESRARLVGAILDDCDAVEPGLIIALAVAYASEGLSTAERSVIERISDAAQLPRARLAELVAKVERDSEAGSDGPKSLRNLIASGPKSERNL